jgi:carbamoyltransferase
MLPAMAPPYILGLNQYTHSAAACLLDASGEVVCALAKERITRKKHDGGDNAAVVEAVLEYAGIDLGDLALVVANNHLFRIRPFEQTLDWASALHQYVPSYRSRYSLLPGVDKFELSHHLSHAWSVLPHAPFAQGLILVADGIGSSYADCLGHTIGSNLGGYQSDADLPKAANYSEVPPPQARANASWREGETVYRFEGLRLESYFKRWIQERSPSLLYNYGFENMESLGAVYSRISSHIFGDWNACGKIMGMAPWAGRWTPDPGPRPVMQGPLESLAIDWPRLQAEAGPNQWADSQFHGGYARLSADVQTDLESILLEFLTRLQRQTGEKNLCMVGGVALNSTANGRIAREAGFEQVFLPPWPGDDGVAIGCALYGHHFLQPDAAARRHPISPYLGGQTDAEELAASLSEFAAWIEVETVKPVDCAADALAASQVIGWFQGRSEFGPRALGNRSILADPRDGDMIERINSAIKKRESFRPFAPTVLAERAAEYFLDVTPSPYMSITVAVRPHCRDAIPAVVHIDGTARLQTLQQHENPLYYQLIQAFQARTGLPMLLNTSFNIKGEPIVETAADALANFLDSDLDLLIIADQRVSKRAFPATEVWPQVRPIHQAGFSAEVISNAEGEAVSVSLMGQGQAFESDSLELGIIENCTGESSLSQLLADFESEYEVPAADVLEKLQRLYRRRLIYFLDAEI